MKNASPALRTLAPEIPASPEFIAALSQESIARARQFVAGIKAYQQHHAQRTLPDAPVIRQEGNTRLREYKITGKEGTILLIPSLVNRTTILDLDEGQSFARFLAESGFRVWVVDWDTPSEAEQSFSLTDYVTQRLIPFLESAGETVHVIGYCMGGLLALALATLRPHIIRSLTLIATPWDFHRPDSSVGDLFRVLAPEFEKRITAQGTLSVEVLQSLFAFQQPFQALGKFMSFATQHPDTPEARRFVLLEDWLNDGVPLAGPVARECLNDWYGANLPARNLWRVGGQQVDPSQLTMPSYVIVPDNDRIVPPESSLPVARLLPRATKHQPNLGHIGLMASRRAPKTVWEPLGAWLRTPQ